jgi:hypothetical protein
LNWSCPCSRRVHFPPSAAHICKKSAFDLSER